MEITHLGHSTLLLDVDGTRILLDPGSFSDGWHGLTELDAIVITHLHPDHVDPEKVPELITRNPEARVITEPSVPDVVDLPTAERLAADSSVRLGTVLVSSVGGQHAVIHRDIPVVGNIGVIVSAAGHPTLFHPGDSLATCPPGIDLLALPVMGPWAALKEHIDFTRTINAPLGFPIHDGLLNERGRNLLVNKLGELSETRLLDLRDEQAHSF